MFESLGPFRSAAFCRLAKYFVRVCRCMCVYVSVLVRVVPVRGLPTIAELRENTYRSLDKLMAYRAYHAFLIDTS